VRDQTRKEFEESARTFCGMVNDEAVTSAYNTFKSVMTKWKKKIKANLRFKSRKNPKQNFIIQKLANRGVYLKLLGECFITEKIPEEAIGKMSSVSFHNRRWFLNCKKFISIKKCDIQTNFNKIVSVDQGIRTFATSFSPEEVNYYGDNFVNEKLIPLFKKLDVFLSKLQLLKNAKAETQWYQDQFDGLTKKINKIRNRISDLVNDLHKKIAFDLVKLYDYIILPRYETSQMVKKKGRKLDRIRTRAMNSLSSFSFKTFLKFSCLKYGKKLLDSTEEYTSKTRSWNGVIDYKLGGKKIIKDDEIIVNRDINGARGIFLLALTR
jgi:putative transposase